MGITIFKIRRTRVRLIFNMGINISVKRHIHIATAPGLRTARLPNALYKNQIVASLLLLHGVPNGNIYIYMYIYIYIYMYLYNVNRRFELIEISWSNKHLKQGFKYNGQTLRISPVLLSKIRNKIRVINWNWTTPQVKHLYCLWEMWLQKVN